MVEGKTATESVGRKIIGESHLSIAPNHNGTGTFELMYQRITDQVVAPRDVSSLNI
jgi:hypothetical protein